MLEILATYQGQVTQAITIGAILGVIGGIVLLTAEDARLRMNAITLGVFVGFLGMLLYQAVRLDNLTNWSSLGFSLAMERLIYEQGPLFWEAFLRIVQASFLGGVLALIFVAPGRALKGALLGVALGVISALVVWGGLRLAGVGAFPQLFFALLVASVFLFLFEIMPLRE